MAFSIRISVTALSELKAMKAFEKANVLDELERQLKHEPAVATRNRKCLESLVPAFEHAPPIWELRIGDIRVFYDVDADRNEVIVRAVRRKTPNSTTEEIVR